MLRQRRTPITLLAVAAASLALALPALAAGLAPAHALTPAATGVPHTVSVFNFGYEDSATATPITVANVGDSVTFVWDSGVHTVTSGAAGRGVAAAGDLDSPILSAGASWTFTAPEAGVFAYTCKLHPSMQGVLVVQD